MLHAPDTATGMFTQAKTLELLHCATVRVITKKQCRCMMLVWGDSMHVYSMCFPAAPVVRPLYWQ